MKTTYLRINPADNVAVAISPLHAGETIEADGRVITLRTDVPAGHKVTLKNFQAGENIIKYGYPIGHVTVDVPEGTWVSEKEIKLIWQGCWIILTSLWRCIRIFLWNTACSKVIAVGTET